MTVPLAARLRGATRALHADVEGSALMRRLLRGTLPQAPYVLLLRSLIEIYGALERGLAQPHAQSRVGSLRLQGLAREPALMQDLEQLAGPAWRTRLAPVPAAAAYAAHLEALAERRPLLLAAHAYVRYLGDLNGGQALARIVSRGLGRDAAAVAFYDFGGAARARALAGALREGLDALARDEPEAQALVDEAVAAFERHRALFDEIDQASREDLPVA